MVLYKLDISKYVNNNIIVSLAHLYLHKQSHLTSVVIYIVSIAFIVVSLSATG